jgi:hypothetical protein
MMSDRKSKNLVPIGKLRCAFGYASAVRGAD